MGLKATYCLLCMAGTVVAKGKGAGRQLNEYMEVFYEQSGESFITRIDFGSSDTTGIFS